MVRVKLATLPFLGEFLREWLREFLGEFLWEWLREFLGEWLREWLREFLPLQSHCLLRVQSQIQLQAQE